MTHTVFHKWLIKQTNSIEFEWNTSSQRVKGQETKVTEIVTRPTSAHMSMDVSAHRQKEIMELFKGDLDPIITVASVETGADPPTVITV